MRSKKRRRGCSESGVSVLEERKEVWGNLYETISISNVTAVVASHTEIAVLS